MRVVTGAFAFVVLAARLLLVAAAPSGCAHDAVPGEPQDLRLPVAGDAQEPADLAAAPDLLEPLNECQSREPTCAALELLPPFPLRRDPRPDPTVNDVGVRRDGDGRLILDGTLRTAIASL